MKIHRESMTDGSDVLIIIKKKKVYEFQESLYSHLESVPGVTSVVRRFSPGFEGLSSPSQ